MGRKPIPELKKRFANGNLVDESDFGDVFDSFLHKDEKVEQEQILGLNDSLDQMATKQELANATTNFKGYHANEIELKSAYPQVNNKKDFFAWVGSPYPGTVYKVYDNGGGWTDTGETPTQQEIDLAGYLKKTELTTELTDEKNTSPSNYAVNKRITETSESIEAINNRTAQIDENSDGKFGIRDTLGNYVIEISNKGVVSFADLDNIKGLLEYIKSAFKEIEETNSPEIIVKDDSGTVLIHIKANGAIVVRDFELVQGLASYIRKQSNTVEPAPIVQTLFTANKDFGSKYFRIPFIAIANNGNIVAGCDIRYNGGDDTGRIDTGVKISQDNGLTWGQGERLLQYTGSFAKGRKTDPCVTVDRVTGRIYVFAHLVDTDAAWQTQTQEGWYLTNSDLVYKYSDDNGLNWSEEISIKTTHPELYPPKTVTMFGGTGAGITMQDGTVVLPAQLKRSSTNSGANPDANGLWNIQACFLYLTPENKQAQKWQISSPLPAYTSENHVVEYELGKLMINARSYISARRVFVTGDMGATWQAHESDKTILEPGQCQASFVKTSIFGKEYGLFSNPQDASIRQNISLLASKDFINWKIVKQIYAPKTDGYTCIASNSNALFVLVEKSGNVDLYNYYDLLTQIPHLLWE